MARPAIPPAMKDALLSAVVAKLPLPGSPWPSSQREAWFDMMRKAVDVAYGPVQPPVISIPTVFVPPAPHAAPPTWNPNALSTTFGAPGTLVEVARFCIDTEGYALRDDAQIDPEEIPPGTVVHDYRRQPIQEYDPIMWKSHGAKEMALPPGVVIAAATEPWKGKAYNGKVQT